MFCFQLRAMLPEYYDDLCYHTSWLWVLWEFVTNPKMGPYARIKRKPRVEQAYLGVNMLDEYIDGVSGGQAFEGKERIEKIIERMIQSSTGLVSCLVAEFV